MIRDMRRQQILEQVALHKAIAVKDLATQLGCSEVTLRRDLDDLAARGLVKRAHGVVLAREATDEPSAFEAMYSHVREKEAIARYVADNLISGSETIILDAGTTTVAIAKEIMARRLPVTVLTNSVPIVATLATSPHLHVFVAGGEYRENIGSLVGDWTERSFSTVHAETAFVGANGIDVTAGITTPDAQEGRAKQAMIAAAKRLVVVADHTKVGRVSLTRVAPLSKIDVLVTDDGIPQEDRNAIEKAGVCVEVVRVDPQEPL